MVFPDSQECHSLEQVQSLNSNGELTGVCCAGTCGVCGGLGCSDRPGGGAQCCTGVIVQRGVLCADDDYATVSTVGCLVSPPPSHSTCPGFPTHSALTGGYSNAVVGTNEMPYFPNSLSACAVVIGFTSFEEPSSVQGYSSAQSLYYDQVSGSVHHILQENSGQNPVSYESCSAGNAELGFRTYYTHIDRMGSDGVADGDFFSLFCFCFGILLPSSLLPSAVPALLRLYTTGDKIGVIGDSSTILGNLGPHAAHGSQFFMLEDTQGFVHVHMDAVNVVDYTAVEMRGWVNVQELDYDLCNSATCESRHQLKIWAEEAVDMENPPAGVSPGGSVMDCALLRCGNQAFAGELDLCSEPERCASLREIHAVRCCSDVAKVGWKEPVEERCAVWTATKKVTGTCVGTFTDFAGAEAHCASAGARLCTAEELSTGCTAGTGCMHDRVLVWTSTISTTWSEVILLDGTQNDGADLMLDTWTQHRAPLQGFTEVSIGFGLATTAPNEVWFDWFSVVGTGPDRSSSPCNAAVCSVGQFFEYSSCDSESGQAVVDFVHWKVRPGGKCQSQAGWISSLGHSCLDHFTKQLCTQFGGYGPGWNASMGTFSDSAQGGVDATRACCECGGGVVDAYVHCKDCQAGWADFDLDPTTPCELCPDGASSMPGSTYCGTCPVGKFGQPGAPECLACVAGQYDHDQDSATGCLNCIGGRYSLAGATACIDCQVGQFNMAGGPECVVCGIGTNDHDSDASTPCALCPNGADKHAGLSACRSV
eukprot:COSAG02_NODE_865_length_16381_cov_14.799533_3_plen_763_part_00